ncbi:hypothetical protein V8C34DRAFT_299695 [Trichoderma compactum]
MEYRYSNKMPVLSTEFPAKDGNVAAAAQDLAGTPQFNTDNSTVTSGSPHAATPGNQSCIHDNSSDQILYPNCNTFAFLDHLIPPPSGPSIENNFNVFNNYTSNNEIKL